MTQPLTVPPRAANGPESAQVDSPGLLGGVLGGLFRSSVATLILRVAFSGLSFAGSVILARSLDRAGFGTYTYVLTTLGFMSVGGIAGMDQLLIRNVAAYRTRGQWSLLKGLLQWAAVAGLLLSLLIAAAVAFPLHAWLDPGDIGARPAMLLGLLLLPIVVLNRMRQAALQGLQRIVAAQIPDMLVQPTVLLVLVGAIALLPGVTLTAPGAVAVTLVAATMALLAGLGPLARHFPPEARAAHPAYETGPWMRQALPLFLLSLSSVVSSRVDVLILGAVKGSEAVGVYAAASRAADLITLFLSAFNIALAPTIARLYAAGDLVVLQRTVTRGSRLVLAFSLPVALILSLYGRWLLMVFGQGFTGGYTALVILALGQVVGVAAGSVTLLLTMSGYERDAAKVIAVTAVWNVAANAVCIPLWGLEGAAVATSSGLILWNVLMAVYVRRRLGIHPTVFGVRAPRA